MVLAFYFLLFQLFLHFQDLLHFIVLDLLYDLILADILENSDVIFVGKHFFVQIFWKLWSLTHLGLKLVGKIFGLVDHKLSFVVA